eukprot:2516815-Pyramimonas_sp.AAC.1
MEGHVDAPLQREVPGNERPEDLLAAARPDHVVDLAHGTAQAGRDLVETRAATASLTWHLCLQITVDLDPHVFAEHPARAVFA